MRTSEAAPKQRFSDFHLLRHFLWLLLEDFKVSTGQRSNKVTSACHGSYPASPPRGTLQEHFLREAFRGLLGASDAAAQATSAGSSIWSSNSSTLTSSWVTELLKESALQRKLSLAMYSWHLCSSGHDNRWGSLQSWRGKVSLSLHNQQMMNLKCMTHTLPWRLIGVEVLGGSSNLPNNNLYSGGGGGNIMLYIILNFKTITQKYINAI